MSKNSNISFWFILAVSFSNHNSKLKLKKKLIKFTSSNAKDNIMLKKKNLILIFGYKKQEF